MNEIILRQNTQILQICEHSTTGNFFPPPKMNLEIDVPEECEGTIFHVEAVLVRLQDWSGSLISSFHPVPIEPVQSGILTLGSPAVGIKKRE